MLLDAVESRALLACALRKRFAVLAVNADSPGAITDCLEAALDCRAPIIIETSLWQLTGRSFGAGDALLGMSRYLAELGLLAGSERYRDVPVLFHTDHIKGPDTLRILRSAVRGLPASIAGVPLTLRPSTISLDSSELSEEKNIELLCALCEEAVAASAEITLEMEAGVDAGVTPIEVARRLLGGVEARHPRKVYLWAPGVGTQHGFSDKGYPAFSPASVAEHRDFASRLTGRDIGIALHGSSGLPDASLRDAVAAGAVKVNWSSESLLVRSQAAREYFAANGHKLEKAHPGFKSAAMDDGVQSFVSERYVPKVSERIRILGGSGMAPECVSAIRGA
jgi:fructose-bisphosphate aldolase class II